MHVLFTIRQRRHPDLVKTVTFIRPYGERYRNVGVLEILRFSEHEVGFCSTGGVASFPDCSKPTFYGTSEHASRKGRLLGCPRIG
jgi:hypothetical protein